MGIDGISGFDGWLERELKQHALRVAGPNPLPSQARYHAVALAGTALGALSFAILSTKTVTAAAVSVVAIVAAGATTEAVITHSANPAVWGHQVVQQVEKCKVALPPGGHGIGECVSSFASQVGPQENKTPGAGAPNPNSNGGSSNGQPAGGAPAPGAGAPNPNSNGGSSNGQPAGGPPSDHPQGGPPSDHPQGGPPSDHPKGGPPSSHPTPGNSGGNSGGNPGNGNGSGHGHDVKP